MDYQMTRAADSSLVVIKKKSAIQILRGGGGDNINRKLNEKCYLWISCHDGVVAIIVIGRELYM